MKNPLPERVRAVLYLIAAVALQIAAGNTIPQPYLSWLISASGALLVLAAANVTIPGGKQTEADVDKMPPEES